MWLDLYDHGSIEVELVIQNYSIINNLAILIVSKGQQSDPIGYLTVNLDIGLPYNQAFVDVNNCEWAEEFIKENELGKCTGDYFRIGYVNYPLYEFDLDKIRELNTEN